MAVCAKAAADEPVGKIDPRLLPHPGDLASLDAATRRDVPASTHHEIDLDPRQIFPITAGLRVGTEFPEVLSSLGVARVVTLEAGYLLPFWRQRLQLFVDGSWTKGKRSTSRADARLPGNTSRSYGTREREVVLSVGSRLRLFRPTTPLNFYGRLGISMDVHKSSTLIERERGIALYRENIGIPGIIFAGGLEYMLGPGALSAELSLATEFYDLRFGGAVARGGIGCTVGYHFLF